MPFYITRLESQLSDALSDLEDAKARIDERQEEINKLQADNIVLGTELNLAEERCHDYELNSQHLVDVLSKLQRDLADHRQMVRKLEYDLRVTTENYEFAVAQLLRVPAWLRHLLSI